MVAQLEFAMHFIWTHGMRQLMAFRLIIDSKTKRNINHSKNSKVCKADLNEVGKKHEHAVASIRSCNVKFIQIQMVPGE